MQDVLSVFRDLDGRSTTLRPGRVFPLSATSRQDDGPAWQDPEPDWALGPAARTVDLEATSSVLLSDSQALSRTSRRTAALDLQLEEVEDEDESEAGRTRRGKVPPARPSSSTAWPARSTEQPSPETRFRSTNKRSTPSSNPTTGNSAP